MVQRVVLLRLSSSIGPFQPPGQPYDMDSGRTFCALFLVSGLDRKAMFPFGVIVATLSAACSECAGLAFTEVQCRMPYMQVSWLISCSAVLTKMNSFRTPPLPARLHANGGQPAVSALVFEVRRVIRVDWRVLCDAAHVLLGYLHF